MMTLSDALRNARDLAEQNVELVVNDRGLDRKRDEHEAAWAAVAEASADMERAFIDRGREARAEVEQLRAELANASMTIAALVWQYGAAAPEELLDRHERRTVMLRPSSIVAVRPSTLERADQANGDVRFSVADH